MKEKFVFYSIDDAITHTYPIRPAREFEMPWVSKVKENFQNTRKDYSLKKHIGTHMCSGIMNLVSNSWILTTWQDIVIRTNGDGESLDAIVPSHSPNGVPAVGVFGGDQLGYYTNLPPNTLKQQIKINLPWCFHAPDGWGLMYLPLQYHGESRFTSAVGVVNPVGGNQLNSILFWHVMEGDTLIKAGTPLCYLYPIKLDSNFDFEVRTVNEKEDRFEKSRSLLLSSAWINNKSAVTNLYKKVFGK